MKHITSADKLLDQSIISGPPEQQQVAYSMLLGLLNIERERTASLRRQLSAALTLANELNGGRSPSSKEIAGLIRYIEGQGHRT
jgi:hypothetical protein